MDKDALLDLARKRVFGLPYSNFSIDLAKETVIIGLARLLALQEHLGYEPDSVMFCLPGFGPTKGTDRLQRGYSLGLILRYNYLAINAGKEPLIILDPKLNCCGVLVATFSGEFPSQMGLKDKLKDLMKGDLQLEGVKISIDKYLAGNHFINTYQRRLITTTDRRENSSRGQWIVIHGSGEVRKDSSLGMGVYIDESQQLQKIAKSFNTPIGPINYLLGDEAMNFLAQYRKAELFSARAREFLAENIVSSDVGVICNPSHLTLNRPGGYFLGLYPAVQDEIYPFLIGEKEGVALVRAKKGLQLEDIKKLGWLERLIEMGILELANSINVVSHGGGKIYEEQEYRLVAAHFDGIKTIYAILNGETNFNITHLKNLGRISYQGEETLNELKELRLIEETERLLPGERGFSLNVNNWR